MHFHLPKPLHGWREFIGEIGIIVIGVLIALGCEQLVETIRWHRELAAERRSLLAEASDSLFVVALRQSHQPCVDRRLREIRLVLERHHRGQPLGLGGNVGMPTQANATRGTWQIALAGQALTHMPHDEKLAYSDAFGEFDFFDARIQEERSAWLRLAPLNNPDILTEADWSGITSAYAEAAFRAQAMQVITRFVLRQVPQDLPEIGKYRRPNNVSAFQQIEDQICKPLLALTSAKH